MYLRTTRRKNADGSIAQYYQLAENSWDSAKGCAVAKVIYNFGRAEILDRAALERLARSILRAFSGEEALAAQPDVKVIQAWAFGTIHVVGQVWQELEIPKILAELSRAHRTQQPFERALFAMVANRLHDPCSKLRCFETWLPEEVFLPRSEDLELQNLYRAMDFWEAHKEKIEEAVYFRMADLMNADVDLIFYDTTSLHFEIDLEDEYPSTGNRLAGEKPYPPLRRRGHSKNGRTDAPQLVVGMAVTREGLPVRSWVFPGNTSDVTTIEKVKKDLKGWRLGRCVFVGAAGMNSDENRTTLSLGGGKYILASRMRAGDEVTKEVLTRPGRYKAVMENIQVKEVTVGDGERRRRYAVCFNPAEAERQKKHRAQVLRMLKEELASLKKPVEGKSQSKRVSELLTSGRFARYLRQTKKGLLRINRAAVKTQERLDGKWVVTSNDDTLSAEDMALGYKQLMRVEECWRSMKSGLRTRPLFHWTSHRICAHVSLCVMALLIERILEIRAKDTWRNIQDLLNTIQVIEYERGGASIRQTTEVSPQVAEILKLLRAALPPKLHHVGSAADPKAA